MQRARAFFYVCTGIFLLAASFHLGAQSAGAQARSAAAQANKTIVAFTGSQVMLANGEVWSVGPLYEDPRDMARARVPQGDNSALYKRTYVGKFWQFAER